MSVNSYRDKVIGYMGLSIIIYLLTFQITHSYSHLSGTDDHHANHNQTTDEYCNLCYVIHSIHFFDIPIALNGDIQPQITYKDVEYNYVPLLHKLQNYFSYLNKSPPNSIP